MDEKSGFVFIRSLKHEGKDAWDGSKNVLWWGPNRSGYVEDLQLAGTYPEGAAREIVADGTPGGNVLVPVESAKAAAVGRFVPKISLETLLIPKPEGVDGTN